MTESTAVLLLSKVLPLLVYPLGLTLSLAAAGAVLSRLRFPGLAWLCFGAAVAVLWIASTPLVADWAIAGLERQYPARPITEMPQADVAIVLGGAVAQPVPPRMETELTDAADRVRHAARLHRAGKVRRILVTAGNSPWGPAARPEAEIIRDLLIEWGVPPEAIEIATRSRNTHENAVEIAQLRKASSFDTALLVTSAAHMPRAMATFRRAGIPVIAATTDIGAIESRMRDPLAWLPQADALAMTTVAVKEWVGLMVYRARGYL
jgi:uncharacterized SAM-binding protein YcdF (DUF218 family)